jgi:hypothetical protein
MTSCHVCSWDSRTHLSCLCRCQGKTLGVCVLHLPPFLRAVPHHRWLRNLHPHFRSIGCHGCHRNLYCIVALGCNPCFLPRITAAQHAGSHGAPWRAAECCQPSQPHHEHGHCCRICGAYCSRVSRCIWHKVCPDACCCSPKLKKTA